MKKNLIAVGVLLLTVLLIAPHVKIQSVEEYYRENPQDIPEGAATVTLRINCRTALENKDLLDPDLLAADLLPASGEILAEGEYILLDGDTVFDILNRAAVSHKIPLDYQGSGKNGGQNAYIRGIGYLYEFSCGPLSGWTYQINGKSPGVGCGGYQPVDGDTIEWLYTCDLGRDIGSVPQPGGNAQ